MPWLFWKWIIPLYISVVTTQLVIFLDFLIAVISNDPFLIFTRTEGEVVWIFLPLVPTLLILFEWPFNQIPFDWRMVFFPILLCLFYLMMNLIICALDPDRDYIYDDF